MMLPWGKQAGRPASDVGTIIADADIARERGDDAQAIAGYTAAHEAAPDRIYPLFWLASMHADRRDYALAERYARAGLAIDPGQIGLLFRLGAISHAQRDPVEALDCYERIRALDAGVPGIDALLADQLCYVGRVDQAIAAFERALERSPESLAISQNRLFCLNYTSRMSPAELADAHRAWGREHEARVQPLAPSSRLPGHPLRIGFVSGDLREHAVARFVSPLFEHHDRSRVEFTCFDTSPDAEDAVTATMRTRVRDWQRVGDLSDEALAKAVRDSGIDVLVDLAGHTRHNRLLVFARKPARVQVSWLGYLSTTGLTRIDYRLTDAHMDPPGMTEALYTERLLRLPVQACFAPGDEGAPVEPSPAGEGEPVTYGSLNQWPKVSEDARRVFATILVRNPQSRLLVVARGGQNPRMQRLVAESLARHGARLDQVQVLPFMTRQEFNALARRVDVALDPFPYGGGTTTFQCLWMGVPVVTLAGRTAISRNSIGPLVHAGLGDLVAASADDYVRIASDLGADVARLRELRSGLRGRLAASILQDGKAFARAFEAACDAMWREVAARSRR
jgi:predicted O-linked N-acetylglucosamine transferase (SPINDLY family)